MDCWIVVVDDEPISLTNAKTLLEEENIRVSCLTSGKSLLKYIEKYSPDLVLLDVMMPEMDGFETYEALRNREDELGKNHIPVIFLTADYDSDSEQRGLKIGASDFIRKPFNKDILKKRIQNTIANSRTIESLTEEATIDQLTGFLNKAIGTKKISDLCNENTGSLMLFDLDSFKLVNDLYGHDMGDQVLQAFADIVRKNTRETDTISRIGGDEFLGFFPGIIEESAVFSLTERLNKQLFEEAARLMGDDNGIPLGISIGVVFVPEYGRDFDSLFALADTSMYSVKQNGKHGYSIYDLSEQEEQLAGDLEDQMERILKTIEERNEKTGALLLGRESFSIAYRFIIRFYKRYGGSDVRIIFSISSDGSDPSYSIPEISAQFGLVLQNILRSSDLIMQNRSDQFFVLLTERSKFEAEAVIQRVLRAWNNTEYSKGVNISYFFRATDYSGEI